MYLPHFINIIEYKIDIKKIVKIKSNKPYSRIHFIIATIKNIIEKIINTILILTTPFLVD